MCAVQSSGQAKESRVHRWIVSAIGLELPVPTEEMIFFVMQHLMQMDSQIILQRLNTPAK